MDGRGAFLLLFSIAVCTSYAAAAHIVHSSICSEPSPRMSLQERCRRLQPSFVDELCKVLWTDNGIPEPLRSTNDTAPI